MNKKILKYIVPLLIVAVIGMSLAFALNRHKETRKSYGSELSEHFSQLMSSTFHSEIIDTLDMGDSFETLTDNSFLASSTLQLSKLNGLPEYEGLSLDATLRKDNSTKEALADLRGKHNEIQLMSSKIYLNNTSLKMMIPKLFRGIITFDTTNFSEKLNNSIFSMVINKSIDLSFLDNLSFDNLVEKASGYSPEQLIQYLCEDFKELYPDDAQTISDNIYVSKDENGYTFTIKSKAMKLFLTDAGSYLFDSQMLKLALSEYLNLKYAQDPYLSDYYTLDEYKELFIDAAKDSVNSTTTLLSDVINFDINVKFELDDKGNIKSISYVNTNDEVSIDTIFNFVPLSNTTNVDGHITVKALDNTYTLSMSKESAIENSDVSNVLKIAFSDKSSDLFSFDYDSSYKKSDNTFDININGKYGEEAAGLSFSTTIDDVSNKSISLTPSLSATINSTQCVQVNGTFSLVPLDYKIVAPKGKEYDIFSMKLSEMTPLITEISENINSIKGQLN